MYDDLVKRLREIHPGEFDDKWDFAYACLQAMHEAADAIEELQKVANKLLAKYQEEATGMIWEYSGHIEKSLDNLHKEISTYQVQIDGRSEPPKEE